eukprot:CAMPEP_0201632036 /NCGR_PEP_ID=MMETSP0493-20130528/5806_1 /ASSEMBLY_ACC=CAM_ASM_000838 /TAXON_ID=420259 /ORGANISM="Thalassiosira gravida, Strain GMp14c1" /LENGTH=647 /DNA_ID=CAMNT_0048103473 /DNA_START=604 /DNA_END=2547 /DNA_ORIENTATION=-
MQLYPRAPEEWTGDVENTISDLCNRSGNSDSDTSEYFDQVAEESLNLLYQGDGQKLKGINTVLKLCRDARFLEDIIQNHQLMSAFARLFGESENLPTNISFALGKLFLAFSLVENFQQILSSHRVGAFALGVIGLELKRALHRRADPTLSSNDAMQPNGLVDLPTRYYSFSKKQEHVIFLCLSILDNLADDMAVLRKMIKKSLVSLLTPCLQQKSINSILVTLSLLKKASIFEETATELSTNTTCSVISELTHLLNNPHIKIVQEVTATLFNLSFHRDCANLISAEIDHSMLGALLQEPSICTHTLQLMYHLSSSDEDRQQLFESGIVPDLLDLFQHISSHQELGKGIAGLLVNMSLHPLCAEEMVRLGAINRIFRTIRKLTKSQRHYSSQIIVKVLRNLSIWTKCLQCRLSEALLIQDIAPLLGTTQHPGSYFDTVKEEISTDENVLHTSLYWEKHFWDAHVDFIMKDALQCEDDNMLVEWLGILNNLTVDDLPGGVQWHDMLDEYHSSIADHFQKLLDPLHNDFKLELIIWLGELCSSKESSYWITSYNLIAVLADLLSRPKQDAEMRLQILLAYEKFLLYEETRFQVAGVVDQIIDCLNEECSLRLAAERCLILIEEFDCESDGTPGEIGMCILQRRYEEMIDC